MPEGPEVETIRRSVDKFLCGRKIESIWRSDLSLRTPSTATDFAFLIGCEVSQLTRIGKILLLETRLNSGLFIQFGMSGKLCIVNRSVPIEKHTHLRMTFEGCDDELQFIDARRFGDLWPYKDQLQKDQKLLRVGPDVISLKKKDEHFIVERIRKSERQIKLVLLDQAVLSGIGNIYACEALHLAKVSPFAKACNLSSLDVERIMAACKNVMNEAVVNKGTTFRSYLDANGEKGNNQNHLRVFGKENEPCHVCQKKVCRVVQAGRSTFYCSNCQNC